MGKKKLKKLVFDCQEFVGQKHKELDSVYIIMDIDHATWFCENLAKSIMINKARKVKKHMTILHGEFMRPDDKLKQYIQNDISNWLKEN